jgi:hypothetical protein
MINARLPRGKEGSEEKRNPGHFDERFGARIRDRSKPPSPPGGDNKSMANIYRHFVMLVLRKL